MFRKKCSNCDKKIGKNYDFCPYCGNSFKTNNLQENYGFLGKEDNMDILSFESMDNSFMDKMLENAMKIAEKMIEKQMKNISQESTKFPQPPQITPQTRKNNLEVQFFVNGKRVFPQNTQEQEEMKIE